MNEQQIKALGSVLTTLEQMNVEIHKGNALTYNDKLLEMIEAIAVNFQSELF